MSYLSSPGSPNGGTGQLNNPQSYHMLELIGVSHTGPIISPQKTSFWSRLMRPIPNGTILRDITFEVYSGEVMAVLGSKSSGKSALIDVIAHRTVAGDRTTKGQILLNDVPLTLRLFQEQCGYVSRRTQLIDGLSVKQSLYYMSQMTLKTSKSLKRQRIKQVLSDLALKGISSRNVNTLNISESKRLSIALQLIRDPLLLILDNPTADLDPLNTYFVVSILSNHAKKYGRIIILTMDKPRSDIFPFLDRVTYLCLGDVIYTGSTRMMMDYFRNIGYPCPELENPLMYYLCLSTADRRSRDRFIDSSASLAALIDKFKVEGHEYRKYTGVNNGPMMAPMSASIPLTAYGRASSWTVTFALLGRQLSSIFSLPNFTRRLFVLPIFFAFLYFFLFPHITAHQQSFQTRSALIFNAIVAINFLVPPLIAYTFASHRNRFYEESSRLTLYRGPLFIFTQILATIPFNIITVWLAASIIYWTAGLRYDDWWIERWSMFCAVLWAVFTFAEQHTIGIMCFIKSPFRATLFSITLLNIYLIFGNAYVRSMLSAPDWMVYLNYGNIYHYSYLTLTYNEFQYNAQLDRASYLNDADTTLSPCPQNVIAGRCLFVNGSHFLAQRFPDIYKQPEWSLNLWKNFALNFVFVLSAYAINTIVYIIPIPASLKAKFRD